MTHPTSQAPRLSYRVHPGTGPYLGLVHGFLSSRAQWQLNLQALAEVCTPVTIELWGHGDSPAPTDAHHYMPSAYVEQLEAIRQELGCERWFLCGYSLGAGLTIRYAHHYAEHVAAHIFTNSQSAFAGPETLASWSKEMPTTAEKIREEGQTAIKRIAVHPRFAKRLPAQIYQALIDDAEKLSPHAVAATLETTNLSASTRDIAHLNKRPALLCFGKYEKRFHSAKSWAEANMADLQITEMEAAHGVNMEDSDTFNTTVTEFIQTHS